MLIWAGTDARSSSVVESSVVESFNVMSMVWQKPRRLHGQFLPDRYRSMAVASDGEKAYTFGGWSGPQERCNKLYEVDLLSLECRELVPATSVSPSARTASGLVYVNRRLVMYGGNIAGHRGGTATDDLFVFDLNTSERVNYSVPYGHNVIRNTSLLPPSPYFPCPISDVPIL